MYNIKITNSFLLALVTSGFSCGSALFSSAPLRSYNVWLSKAPALFRSAPLSSAFITSGSLRLRLFPARLLSASSYHVWLFTPPALYSSPPLSPAIHTSGSLRLRLFPARLLSALITSGSLRLRLFSDPLLSAQLLSRLGLYASGSFQLGSFELALITFGPLRLRLFTAWLLSSYHVWLFTAPAFYSLATQLLSRLALYGSGSSQLRLIKRGII
jgi:hypothetical protein